MTREEAIKIIRDTYHTDTELEALKVLVPELRESDNEIHRKWILEYLYDGLRKSDEQFKGQFKSAIDWLEKQKEQKPNHDKEKLIKHCIGMILTDATEKRFKDYGLTLKDCLTWLSVQKEQKPQEELVYRMNGLMQEYIKEGEDDAEKEHRLKCYQLFWDALEDADFFEQKKQKPSINIDQLKSLMLQYLQEAANEKEDSDIEADTDKWARKILGYDFEQKPAEPSDDELQRHQDKLYDFKVFATKQAKEHHISFVHDFEWNNFCAELLSYFAKQKSADEQFPPLEGLDAIKAKYYDDGFKNGFDEGVESVKPEEWSKEDEKMRDYIIHALTNNTHAKEQGPVLYAKEIDWLKSLKDRGNFPKSNTNSPSEWSEEDEKMRKSIIWVLESFVSQADCESNPSFTCSYPTYYKEIDWLKSLRPSWKPSEEQMEALSETIAFAPDTFKPKCTLVTLQDDLKNL